MMSFVAGAPRSQWVLQKSAALEKMLSAKRGRLARSARARETVRALSFRSKPQPPPPPPLPQHPLDRLARTLRHTFEHLDLSKQNIANALHLSSAQAQQGLYELSMLAAAVALHFAIPYAVLILVRGITRARRMFRRQVFYEQKVSERTTIFAHVLDDIGAQLARTLATRGPRLAVRVSWLLFITRWILLLTGRVRFDRFLKKPFKLFCVAWFAVFMWGIFTESAGRVSAHQTKDFDEAALSSDARRSAMLMTIRGIWIGIMVAVVLLLLRFFVGIPLGAVAAFGGGSGLAIGFAAQRVIENVFGGLSVFLGRPFNEGDVIKANDFHGTVESFGTAQTRLRMPDRSTVFVPNAEFVSAVVTNETMKEFEIFEARIEMTPEAMDNARRISSLVRQFLEDSPFVVKTVQPRARIDEIHSDGTGILMISCALGLGGGKKGIDHATESIFLNIRDIIRHESSSLEIKS